MDSSGSPKGFRSMGTEGQPIMVDNDLDATKPATLVRRPLLRRVALVEIVVFLGGALLLEQLLLDGNRFHDIQPHPFWILVVLISVQYGTRMGLVSALACTVVFLFGNMPERMLDQDVHQWFFSVFKLPILWSISAVVIGEISARHIGARFQLARELSESYQREATLSSSFHALNAIKERMEIHMAGQRRTVRKTLEMARAMEQLDPSWVFDQSLDLVENLLEPEKFSMYILRDNALHHSINRGWGEDEDYLRVFGADVPLFSSVVGERRLVCVSNTMDEGLLDGQGVLAGPLIVPETGELLGMLKVEKLAFGQLCLNTVKDFEFLCGWIGAIYGKAAAYKIDRDISFSDAGQLFQGAQAYKLQKDYLTDLARRVGFNLTRIKVSLSDYEFLPTEMRSRFSMVLGQAVKDSLRQTDLIFHSNKGGEFILLLPSTEKEYAGIVKGRLRESLEDRLASMADEIEYALETQSLADVDGFMRYSPGSLVAQEHPVADGALFAAQKNFLAKLAVRLKYPVTMLYLYLDNFDDLSEIHVKRFSFILKKVLENTLGSADQALLHCGDPGGYSILLPGMDVVQTSEMVLVLETMLDGNKEEIPVSCNHHIQVLEELDSEA